jgi:iron-sulfur cluster assembly protein
MVYCTQTCSLTAVGVSRVLPKNCFLDIYLCLLFSGIKVLIDSKAQLSLLGTEMDFVENTLSSEFVFNNPNIKGTCGCGESFNI